eukprot:scaffold147846_cov25-Cyclotella_meneghiniana.AAC.1
MMLPQEPKQQSTRSRGIPGAACMPSPKLAESHKTMQGDLGRAGHSQDIPPAVLLARDCPNI